MYHATLLEVYHATLLEVYHTIRVQHRTTNILLLVDLYPEQLVGQRVDHDQDVRKLGLEDGSPVVPPVLAPHDVNLVVPQVADLMGQGRRGEGRERTVTACKPQR